MRLKYNFIGLILACGLGLSSCNDSFLDRNPKDQLSDASFWKNAEDAQKFATGIYLYLISEKCRKTPGIHNRGKEFTGDTNDNKTAYPLSVASFFADSFSSLRLFFRLLTRKTDC